MPSRETVDSCSKLPARHQEYAADFTGRRPPMLAGVPLVRVSGKICVAF